MKIFILTFISLISIVSCSQKEDLSVKDSKAFQYKINLEYADKKSSPLTDKDFIKFSSLDFFKINKELSVLADFKRTPNEKPFKMLTTTSRLVKYVKFGEAHFKIKDKSFKLNIYQNQEIINKPEYKNHLFLPFTDLTNGKESYGSGRYIDLSQEDITKDNKIVINFNKAYNPYCAYNHKYSCPIPPKENFLAIEINAGVKKFH